ncbi:AfsR/SARP family transcriptional regulator [Microbispora sp. RL4-1S]|uniref:AfsR/SARP family transcriptional regulator n=1 Tax=Microbispora oryzae TaxID=2806554 RepID=A0A940WMY8_9ACTN|nr:AfsR/SARP family transcriptional regulator [Microbispora oryzae]MBP2706817.1 AfsR/SARP family transcriptional regulator [Microbispora oryzae]
MKFLVLGQLTVGCNGREVHFRGGLQCALLAAFIAAEGKVLSVGSLIEELWEDNPPNSVENALQAHVSRLRRKLQSLEGERTSPRLVSQANGYRLILDGAEVDAARFSDALARARLEPASSAGIIADRLREALELWRGPVFGGAVVGPMAQAAAARLKASRTAALELLFDNELKRGSHTYIVPELTALVRAEGLNERLCELLMIALYRCGRQVDALSVYREIRNRMAEELGVNPSPMLRNHERAVLAHDPELLPHENHLRLRNPVS